MKNIFLLHMHCLPGRKLLLCDDLASHILVEVIDLCRESNVEFVCRPTPLTIAATWYKVFAPMKQKLREQLQKYAECDTVAKLLMERALQGMLNELY
jgi:hypothetical protein